MYVLWLECLILFSSEASLCTLVALSAVRVGLNIFYSEEKDWAQHTT